MNLSAPFVRRPVGTFLLAAATLLAGTLALFALPVAPLPRVDLPTIQVSASLPGASPETMASAVATPLERRLGRIAGLTEMSSTCGLGTANVSLQFNLDRDVEAAARDVQAAIAAARADLPPNLPTRPTARKMNPADAPILVAALTSPTLSPSALYSVANNVLAQKLSQVTGVGQVFVGGGGQQAIRVRVSPLALAARGLTLQAVRQALAAQSVNLPKGALQNDETRLSIAINDQVQDARAARALVVAWTAGGPVRLQDVAEVADGVENERLAARIDGQRAVLLVVRRQPGANIIETVARIKDVLPALVAATSPAIDVSIGLDRSATIRAAVTDVQLTLLLTVFLVVAVVYVFLRDVRATLVPSVAVPLSLVGTFALMYLCGYSLDNLSLMALTISTGFVVDDAIVVTENVIRHLERGRRPIEAALLGAEEVGFTVVSMTLSLIAVFLPIRLMGGVVGPLFREFSAGLSLSVILSAVVSLTVTPAMCALLLRPRPRGQRTPDAADHLEAGATGALERSYARALGWTLRHRRTTLFLTFGSVALTAWLFAALPKGLFPQQDTGMVMGQGEAAQDASFAVTLAKQREADEIVRADPAVDHVVSFIGGGGPGGASSATLFVSLLPRSARNVGADQVVARLRPKLARIVGYNVFLQAAQDMRVGGRAARTQYQYTLQDSELHRLRRYATALTKALQKLPQLRDVVSDEQTAGLEGHVVVDREAAARYGITLRALDDALYDAFGQRLVATRYTEGETFRTVLEVPPAYQRSPANLFDIYVPGAAGAVPLASFARQEVRRTPLAVNHQGQFASITVSFNLAPGVALGEAVEAIDRAKAEVGLPDEVRAAFSGTAQAFQDTTATLPLLLGAALLAVYIVLGVLYEDVFHPLTILSTLPSAGVGALLALIATNTELSIIAFIGVILLVGIVKKNAILVVDFALAAQRRHNVAPERAIHTACLMRLRPILMTTAAALLAGLPLALGTGTGSELRRPLGITIVGGLLVSQLVTLFTTPVVYLALERVRALYKRRLRRAASDPRA